MKTKQTTLENFEPSGYRRDGNSTRQIDNAIQILFDGKICVVIDHHENGQHSFANKDLFRRILKRLAIEHNLTEGKQLRVDKAKLELELLLN